MATSTSPAFDPLAQAYAVFNTRLWDRFGELLVEEAGVRPDTAVADLCAGEGACSVPALNRLGGAGSLSVVDASAAMLNVAHARLASLSAKLASTSWAESGSDDTTREREHGTQVKMYQADALAFAQQHQSKFDHVVCGFGVFFPGKHSATPGPESQTSRLARMAPPDIQSNGASEAAKQSARHIVTTTIATMLDAVRPGGTLAMSLWVSRPFEPLASLVMRAIAEVTGRRPTASAVALRIGSVSSIERIQRVLDSPLLAHHQSTIAPAELDLELTREDVWTLVLGSLMADALPKDQAFVSEIKDRVLAQVEQRHTRLHLEALNVVITRATPNPYALRRR